MLDVDTVLDMARSKSNLLRKSPTQPTLDRIDFEILDALQGDARLSNKELAARVGLAPSSCLLRVRALMRDRVLLGHHAEVDADALGVGAQAFIAVRLVQTSRDNFRALQEHVQSLPEVLAVFHVSGAADLQIHVAVRSIAHLRDLICDSLATRVEVDRCETSIIYGYTRNARLPRYREPAVPERRAAGRRKGRAAARRRAAAVRAGASARR
jgi:DNA-binding Lrp family transcriptional regulator